MCHVVDECDVTNAVRVAGRVPHHGRRAVRGCEYHQILNCLDMQQGIDIVFGVALALLKNSKKGFKPHPYHS